MTIIEIKALENGAHRNQTGVFFEIPEGWAVVPDDMETPNFPFGDVEVADEDIIKVERTLKVEKIDGKLIEKVEETEKAVGTRKVVTKWVAGTIPEAEEPEATVSETEQLRADIDYIAVMTGVEL